MRPFTLVIPLLALAASPVAAQQLQQSVKYTLMIVAGGDSDSARRDGAAMGRAGVYMGRQECEAAGAGIKFGVVNPGAGAPPTITWICVPLGRP